MRGVAPGMKGRLRLCAMGKAKPSQRKKTPRKENAGAAGNFSSKDRVLVTGGAGFIGSVLVGALNRWHGVERIVVVDELGSGDKWRNLSPLAFEDYVEAGDFYGQLENKA
jgi:ADP-L-glycero-D-manno-heptose 6-epimerase